MSFRTVLTEPYAEKTTLTLTATITDVDGVTPLANADSILTTLTLDLYEKASGTVVNSRTAQSIKNTNGGTITSAGLLTLRLDPADLTRVSTAGSETFVALVRWSWGSPTKYGAHEIVFIVRDLTKVT